jgi:hypothetical protein
MATDNKLRLDDRAEAAACQHRWVIEPPNGVMAIGWCRRCGAEKYFPTALEFELSKRHKGAGRTLNQRRELAD